MISRWLFYKSLPNLSIVHVQTHVTSDFVVDCGQTYFYVKETGRRKRIGIRKNKPLVCLPPLVKNLLPDQGLFVSLDPPFIS